MYRVSYSPCGIILHVYRTYRYLPSHVSQDHPRIYSPPLPCLGIQGLPSVSCTSLGSSQDILIAPPPHSSIHIPRPSIPGFPSISGTSRDYPRIVLISPPPPPCPSISGTSWDHPRRCIPVQVSQDSLESQVLPGMQNAFQGSY